MRLLYVRMLCMYVCLFFLKFMYSCINVCGLCVLRYGCLYEGYVGMRVWCDALCYVYILSYVCRMCVLVYVCLLRVSVCVACCVCMFCMCPMYVDCICVCHVRMLFMDV